MTNQEAYLDDLAEVEKWINDILGKVPTGKTKAGTEARKQAEEAAYKAQTTLHCMRNDYIIVEL